MLYNPIAIEVNSEKCEFSMSMFIKKIRLSISLLTYSINKSEGLSVVAFLGYVYDFLCLFKSISRYETLHDPILLENDFQLYCCLQHIGL